MNKFAKTLALLIVMTLAAGANSYAQFVVRVRPARPVTRVVVRRPPAPSPAHVWVDEDWTARGGKYVWHGGYYAAPPRRGAVYVQGHWNQTRRGSVWVPGHWR